MSHPPDISDLTASEVDPTPEPTVVTFSDDSADDILDALSSATARHILQQLRDSPAYATTLADEVETSLQNVHYHLTKLEAAGVIEVVDTVYSERGREMDVYAPTGEPLVLVAGDDTDRENVAETLSKLLGAIGVLTFGSVLVQKFVQWVFYPGGPTPQIQDGGQYAVPPTTNVAPPVGLVVFVAGLVLLVGWVAWRHRRRTAQ